VEQDVLSIPSVTAVGMHPAPLPRGRGRAPIAWSLIKGLEETALSFFHLVEEADAGDLIGQKPILIDTTDDAADLYEKVVDAARELIRHYYPQFEAGVVPRNPQDETQATWWPKRDPHHGLIDWTKPSQEVYNWIRGQTRPYPGAFSYLDGRKVTIWSANPPTDSTAFVTPGEITYVNSETVGVGTWEGIIELTEIQVGDDAPVSADALVSAYDFEVGDVFENARDQLEEER
jgi:Methionyl-tRNA formyltransferase